MMFIWLFFSYIICVFASPTPNQNSRTQFSKRSVPVIKDPKGWNPTQLLQIADGFKDACTLAKAGRDAADPKNPIYLKYFRADQVHNVQAIFKNIIGDDTSPGGSKQRSNPCSSDLSNIRIVRDFPDEQGVRSCANPIALAATRNGKEIEREGGKELLTIICDLGLKHGGINKAYDGKEHNPKGPTAVTCDTIGDRVTYRMDTLGATLLHEYTHYDDISAPPLSDNPTQDENAVEDAKPDDVYGPIDTRAVSQTIYSSLYADSYAWFATQAFWTAECKKEFKEPQKDDDKDPIRVSIPPDDDEDTDQLSPETTTPATNSQTRSSIGKTSILSTTKSTATSITTSKISVLTISKQNFASTTSKEPSSSSTTKQSYSSSVSKNHSSSSTTKQGHSSSTTKKNHSSTTTKKRPVAASTKPKDL